MCALNANWHINNNERTLIVMKVGRRRSGCVHQSAQQCQDAGQKEHPSNYQFHHFRWLEGRGMKFRSGFQQTDETNNNDNNKHDFRLLFNQIVFALFVIFSLAEG